MQSDAHIEDILHTLADPEDFVRGIVGSFLGEQFNRDEAVIRIGISGTGRAPHYCIEQGWTYVVLTGEVDENLHGKEVKGYQRRAIFHGRSHKPILEDNFKGISWSSTAMTFGEIQALLGRLRSSRKLH